MVQLLDIKNGRGDYLRVFAVRYQFPEDTNDFFDANWLIVRVEAAQEGRSWQAEEPCLLTYEVPALGRWFRRLVDGTDVPRDGDLFSETADEAGFMEPCIHFKALPAENVHRVSIYFELEVRPPWRESKFADQNDCFLDFDLDREEISWIAAQLETASLQLPIRGEALRRHEPQPPTEPDSKLQVKFGKHVRNLKRFFSSH